MVAAEISRQRQGKEVVAGHLSTCFKCEKGFFGRQCRPAASTYPVYVDPLEQIIRDNIGRHAWHLMQSGPELPLRATTFSGFVSRIQSNPLRKITSMAVLVACIVPLRLT